MRRAQALLLFSLFTAVGSNAVAHEFDYILSPRAREFVYLNGKGLNGTAVPKGGQLKTDKKFDYFHNQPLLITETAKTNAPRDNLVFVSAEKDPSNGSLTRVTEIVFGPEYISRHKLPVGGERGTLYTTHIDGSDIIARTECDGVKEKSMNAFMNSKIFDGRETNHLYCVTVNSEICTKLEVMELNLPSGELERCGSALSKLTELKDSIKESKSYKKLIKSETSAAHRSFKKVTNSANLMNSFGLFDSTENIDKQLKTDAVHESLASLLILQKMGDVCSRFRGSFAKQENSGKQKNEKLKTNQ